MSNNLYEIDLMYINVDNLELSCIHLDLLIFICNRPVILTPATGI